MLASKLEPMLTFDPSRRKMPELERAPLHRCFVHRKAACETPGNELNAEELTAKALLAEGQSQQPMQS